MARTKRSTAKDVMELVSRFPWPVGVAVAVVLYVWLHVAASESLQVVDVNGAADLGRSVRSGIWHAMASVGQYAFPVLCLVGALTSFIGRRKREHLLADAAGPEGAVALAAVTWREFELLVGQYFRRCGYSVAESKPGPDGGIDVRLVRDGRPTLVQCKHWKTRDVGVRVVREHFGVMSAERSSSGMVVASGGFTSDARSFAAKVGIELVDGETLLNHVRQAHHEPVIEEPAAPAMAVAPDTPSCPRCGGSMVMRLAKRGPHAGQRFLGCQEYPRCKGTKQLQTTSE